MVKEITEGLGEQEARRERGELSGQLCLLHGARGRNGYWGGSECRRKEGAGTEEYPPVASLPQSTGGRPSAQKEAAVVEVQSSRLGTGGGC